VRVEDVPQATAGIHRRDAVPVEELIRRRPRRAGEECGGKWNRRREE
jgi:hypothetical protein